MTPQTRFLYRPSWRFVALAGLLTLVLSLFVPAAQANATNRGNTCDLGNGIQHVIYLQFDNVHFTRDNPNVPSDLEQMPNLLHFLESNGTLLTNHHTPLIAHTATDILTSLTGVYGDQMGVPIANTFRYFNPNGTSNPGVSFAYWTDPIYDYSTTTPTDTTYNMLTAQGKNAPAPWVPYTRAGCNFGTFSMANTALENLATDVPTVFGANSTQAQEVASNYNQAYSDFVGVGVHCALNNATCSSANGGIADKLPQEPGGYTGYQGLFGDKYVLPQIGTNGKFTDLSGNPVTGFNGFDPSASESLAYVAAMQEHNIPITYAYIADAHDNHDTGNAFGPGEAGYVAQLKSYDTAFGSFFTRLKADGIDQHNTLFVVTSDEGDHFVGGAPSPANCNGVTTSCTYSQIGEINGNLAGLLATQQGITTPFKVHSDSAPNIYITGNPARDAAVTRALEQALSKLTATNPITGQTDTLTNYLADPVEMNLLHMITADPARTPTLTMFANPNYYLYAGAANCNAACVLEEAANAWNHGDVSPDINTTWLGLVGPGVERLGVNHSIWSDHTDIRPTMMELLGLRDDYAHEGRVLFEALEGRALSDTVHDNLDELISLARIFKQIDAPVGLLGLASLKISTTALASSSTNDATYTSLENKLISFTQTRNALTNKILTLFEQVEFGDGHDHIDDRYVDSLTQQAQELLEEVLAAAK